MSRHPGDELWEDEHSSPGIGSSGFTLAYDLTDAEVLEFQAEHEERQARRVPVGFRAETASKDKRAGRFPRIPRFDIRPRG